MSYNLITVDKGAVQVNDKLATWRKVVPTADDQVLVSDSTLDKGAEWRASTALPIDQAQVSCAEVSVDLLSGTPIDNLYAPGLENATILNINSTDGQTDITGLDRIGVGGTPLPQCQIIMFNNTQWNIRLIGSPTSGSAVGNQFRINTNFVPLQPNEAVNFYYNSTYGAYMLVSHL